MKNYIKSINKRELLIIGITLIVGLFFGAVFFGGTSENKDSHKHEHEETANEETVYTCSMHPQIKQNEPGTCPICAMDLVPMSTLQADGEDIDPNEIQMSKAAIKLADVQTAIVKKGVPEKSVYLLGKVKADERNISELTARFGGRIEKLYVNYTGQQVYKGQKLATLYSPDLITAQKELLEAIKYKESNPSFYKASRTKLKLWDLTEEQINAIEMNGEPKLYFDILAPISGTVTQRHVAIGDYVKEGSALFAVVNLSRVWVMFDAYESDLPWIKKGDNVEFTLQSMPGKMFNAKVTYIDPFINADTRVAQVRVEIANPKGELKPEMFANGILQSKIAENANELLIPKSSILWTGKRAVVYVKVPNREMPSFLYREIVLGPEAGNFYLVKEGLHQGDEIAINGVFKIDASAQLAGKQSMMNPTADKNMSKGTHEHGDMEEKMIELPKQNANLEHEEFKVSGNCSMCKATIEKAAKGLDGVNSASWSTETKLIHVSFNKEKVSLGKIHKAIAKSGYDTEKETALEEVYNKLPACCLYRKQEY